MVERNKNLMYAAIARRDAAAISRLLSEDPSILHERLLEDTWLHRAAMRGDVQMMLVLVDAGLSIDEITRGGDTPLATASGQGHYDACKWLLARGADVNFGLGSAATPIFDAIFGHNLEIVRLFIEHGADLTARFGEPAMDVMSYAQVYGTPEIVAFLRGQRC